MLDQRSVGQGRVGSQRAPHCGCPPRWIRCDRTCGRRDLDPATRVELSLKLEFMLRRHAAANIAATQANPGGKAAARARKNLDQPCARIDTMGEIAKVAGVDKTDRHRRHIGLEAGSASSLFGDCRAGVDVSSGIIVIFGRIHARTSSPAAPHELPIIQPGLPVPFLDDDRSSRVRRRDVPG